METDLALAAGRAGDSPLTFIQRPYEAEMFPFVLTDRVVASLSILEAKRR